MPFLFEDVALARVKAGAGFSWSVPGGIPLNRIYRPVYVQASVVASGPSIAQLSIHDPSGNAVAYSSPTAVGTTPHTLRVNYPGSSPNFPPSTGGGQSVLLCSLENVCVDKDQTLQHSFIATLRVVLRVGHEQIAKACPTGFTVGNWLSESSVAGPSDQGIAQDVDDMVLVSPSF